MTNRIIYGEQIAQHEYWVALAFFLVSTEWSLNEIIAFNLLNIIEMNV